MSLDYEPLSLSKIFYYGRECLTNRYRQLGALAALWIFVPQSIVLLVVSHDASRFSDEIRSLFEGPAPFTLLSLMNILRSTLVAVLSWHFFATVCFLLGATAMAKSCFDYFESTSSRFLSVTIFSAKILLIKGIGLMVGIVALAFPAAMFSLTRVFFVCLIIMLPVILVSSRRGGFFAVIDTVLMRYARHSKGGRWPAFSQVMTIGGLAMSLVLITSWACQFIVDIDARILANGAWLIEDSTLLGFKMARQHLFVQGIEIATVTVVSLATIPFTAALYMMIQRQNVGDIISTQA